MSKTSSFPVFTYFSIYSKRINEDFYKIQDSKINYFKKKNNSSGIIILSLTDQWQKLLYWETITVHTVEKLQITLKTITSLSNTLILNHLKELKKEKNSVKNTTGKLFQWSSLMMSLSVVVTISSLNLLKNPLSFDSLKILWFIQKFSIFAEKELLSKIFFLILFKNELKKFVFCKKFIKM